MRQLLFVAMLAALGACGGGSGGDNEGANVQESDDDTSATPSSPSAPTPSQPQPDAARYEGIYTLRDHSCTFQPVIKFRITKSDERLVVTILEGNDVYGPGDAYEASLEISETDREVLGDNTGDCQGTFPFDAADAATISEITNISLEASDLILVCDDFESADEECAVSYIKS